MDFWSKYKNITKKNKSYVCVGLDSDFNKIPDFLKSLDDPIFEFNKRIIDKTKDIVVAYKPNYAFYISQGLKGVESLYKTIKYIPDEIPLILDVKVGDIGNTMKHYAKAYFENFNIDAVTVNPLMGEDVILPLEEYSGKMYFALALTSNPSASDFLKKDNLAEKISKFIANKSYKNAGAVVGATNINELKAIREVMKKTLFLIPGIGAQGGSLENVMKYAIYSKEDPRIVINSSRGIIFASSEKDFAEVAREKTIELRDNINFFVS